MCPTGRCCRTGQTCVTRCCCPSGNQQCSSRGCYDPGKGETCCGVSEKYFPKSYYCVFTCVFGTKPCGGGCYDPKTQICCGSGTRTCHKTSTSAAGGFCPKGMKNCETRKYYDPTKETCCPANSGLYDRQVAAPIPSTPSASSMVTAVPRR